MSTHTPSPVAEELAPEPVPDDVVNPGAAQIVNLGQRRADRVAAEQGLVVVGDDDGESVEAGTVLVGTVVDPPDPPGDALAFLDVRRTPVFPVWLSDSQTRRDAMRRAVAAVGYHAGVHAVRIPVYAALVAWYAPQGAARLTGRVLGWTSAEVGNWGLRQDAATRNDAKTWLELDRHRQRQASWRWWVTGAGVLAAVAAVLVVLSGVTPGWARWLLAAVGLVALARYGRPVDKPILARTVVRAKYRKLTAELTRKGIMATGLVKKPEDIVFPAGLGEIRREGPGYLAVADLPDGVIAVDVVDKREQLAGGLRLPLDQVWPETMPREHPGRLALWVADKPVSAMRQPAWPHLSGGATDYFKEFVYGFDPRMRKVMYRMDERNSLFAGFPGSGKSLSGRVVCAAMSLDPIVQFAIFDLAGRGDYDMFEPLCAPGLFGSGADEDTKRAAYRMLLWLVKQCDERGPIIKGWAQQGLNTENKLNRAIAMRDPRVRPIAALIDEIQELINDPELGKAASAAATSVIKRGRALGIHLILETQRIDKESLPKGVTSNIALRTCLAVPSHVEVDLALGTGAFRQGARPNQFEIGVDAGWGVRVGMGPMTTVRAAYLDRRTVEKICAKALALRGGTREQVDLPPARDILADLAVIWVPGERGQHWKTLAPRLAEKFPDAYAALTAEALSALVRALEIESRNVKAKGVTQRGIYHAQIIDALAARDRSDSDDDAEQVEEDR
ncbi:cell division protein FtsK [Actinoplanes sp. TRM 88003]|uniref:Cell division protein FtsK n=1 Tax=Paractinoplanes aksuensis TaxID=2939490 RepID=A0ABT1DPS2_9ACTN|nr:cell division protein FtsK [Actinoplanes aksuensis]MCO8272829.1 cell division protein FtsK [Actinoplanes aksuensis]